MERNMTVGARMRRDLSLALLTLLAAVKSNSMSLPGKPVLLGCRSPEKETFTCWWDPGSDGGLPTTHRFYYERERLEGTHECPDYRSRGRNSCFFNKSHTSIWVEYYLIVVATNALGNTTSDPLTVDVMEIVKPNPPENVTLLVEDKEDSLCLDVRWEPPYNIDTKSGWVTIKYELRVKQENSDEWREYTSGRQTQFTMYSINPGVLYVVQVRCRLDHGFWSEWSNSTSVKIPNSLQNENMFWILVSILSAILFMTTMSILVMKRKFVQQCLLPPVPGPKIKGVDEKLLKSGRSEDVVNALIFNQNFPPTVACKDLIEEYLVVSDNDDGLLTDPFNSRKRKKSSIFFLGYHLDLEIQCKTNAEESSEETDNFEKSNNSLSKENLSNMELCQLLTGKLQCSSINAVNKGTMDQSLPDHSSTAEKTVQPLANSSYVDIQIHESNEDVNVVDYSTVQEVIGHNIVIVVSKNVPGYMDVQRQQEDIPEDYSRVTEVNSDNMVILQKENIQVDSSCREKGDHYTDCTNPKPIRPYLATPTTMCTEVIGSGYVDTVPAPPSMFHMQCPSTKDECL
ncbi:prolactin receptor b [Mastacembelus armatus]|uniref:Prolactin receptor n=1 Tax=Mastacembelus armatus TaxID=205130 RepID=A0A3Q3RTW6_9TELE|nr:prolactin receptor-like [Mastacembelus armatus]XP_026178364.1 prolactin receptor-like [Mastacembelus armatus]